MREHETQEAVIDPGRDAIGRLDRILDVRERELLLREVFGAGARVLRPVVRLAEGAQFILLQGDLLPEQWLQVEDDPCSRRVDLLQVEGDDAARGDFVDDGLVDLE